ncbi:MAG: hypothetical protein ACC663_13320, partial [Gammaproteobacteria bacterium]
MDAGARIDAGTGARVKRDTVAADDMRYTRSMRNIRFVKLPAVVILIVCLLILPVVASTSEKYPLFEAVYDAKIKIAGGQVRMTTTRNENGEYIFEYTILPGKLIRLFTDGELKETTEFKVVDGRPRTLDYTLLNTIGSKPRNGHVVFDWEDNTVKGNYKENAIDIPIPENAVDRAMLQLVLMADLKNNNLQEQYAVYDKDEFIP